MSFYEFQDSAEMSSRTVNKALNSIKKRDDDDLIDRLNYCHSAFLFGTFALLIVARNFFGSPIDCFLPAQFKRWWVVYSLEYCYIKNTYYLDINEDFPTSEGREERELLYYQWFPFILAFQMALMVMPRFFMKSFNSKTGLSISCLCAPKDIQDELEERARHLIKAIHTLNTRLAGLSKNIFVWNTINVMLQLFLVNRYIAPQTENGIWGFDFLRKLADVHTWRDDKSIHFARVTFCDFEVRQIAEQPDKFTVQCVLGANMLAEKFYLIVWIWLFLMCILNTLNLLTWLWNILIDSNRFYFVMSKLEYDKNDPENEIAYNENEVDYFIQNFLFVDGVTTFRIIETNAGENVASSFMVAVWKYYQKKKRMTEHEIVEFEKTSITPPDGIFVVLN